MLIGHIVVIISPCTQILNPYIVHMKLIQCYMSIISERKQKPQWDTATYSPEWLQLKEIIPILGT